MEFKFENNRLNLYVDDKNAGYIEYSLEKDTLTILHTVVFKEYEGQGLARKLMEEIVKYVKENNLKILSECSYASHYLTKNIIN